MLIVADSSALLALSACDALELLDALFDHVRVPTAVYDECFVKGKPEAEPLAAYLAEKVIAIESSDLVVSFPGLGRGELEAMALYKFLHADRLLIDDGRARKVAKTNGIEIVGSLGVLLLAKRKGEINSLKSRIDKIRDAGIRFSDELVAEVLKLGGE